MGLRPGADLEVIVPHACVEHEAVSDRHPTNGVAVPPPSPLPLALCGETWETWRGSPKGARCTADADDECN